MRSVLRIISINDVYKLENLPRLQNLIRQSTLPPPSVTITIIAGDFVAPSLLSSLDAGRAMVDCLNALGIQYAILGNHEDDIAADELHRRVEEFHGTWLSTNVDFDPRMPRDAIVSVGARRVGLIAVVLDDPAVYRSAPFGGAPMRPAQVTAVEAAAHLRSEGCDTVVAITHQSIEADRALAQTGVFPLIVGGHEHVPFLEHIGATWVVKAGSDATAAIISDMTWEGDVMHVSTSRMSVADFPEDADLAARVQRHMAKVHEISEATLVTLAPGDLLSSVGTRVRQTSMGTLLCSRVRHAMEADLCLFNGGGIRASREYTSRFTYGDLETEVPFDNEVVVVRMPGSLIKHAVAASRAHAPAESGGFLQVDRDVESLEDERTYEVALVRNIFVGMDHNEPLMRFAAEHPSLIPPAGSGRDIKHVLVEAFAVELWHKLGGFDALDENQDGVVTEAEVLAALGRVSTEAPSSVTARLLVHTMDKNGDHQVTRSEAPKWPQ